MTQTERICNSEAFVGSKRGKQLLRYLVKAALEERPALQLKEIEIGMEVFGREPGYDPKRDSIARVSMRKLRERLMLYYETDGRNDEIRIDIGNGSYMPTLRYESRIASLALSDRAAMCVVNARTAVDRRTLPSLHAALEYLDMALADHPGHPRLLALKAMVHAVRAGYGGRPRIDIGAAEQLIAQAELHESEVWELCVAQAEISKALHFDWQGAHRLFDRAARLSHGDSRYHLFDAAFQACQLRFAEFLRIKRDAVAHFAFDSIYIRCEVALGYMFLKQFDEAEEAIRETQALFPTDRYMTYIHHALLHEARGDYEQATRVIGQLAVTMPETAMGSGLVALMAGLAGDSLTARRSYDQLLALKRSDGIFIPASQLGCAAIGIGDYDAAAGWYTRAAVEEQDPIMNWIAILPFTRHMHGHPGFRELVTKKMNLPMPD